MKGLNQKMELATVNAKLDKALDSVKTWKAHFKKSEKESKLLKKEAKKDRADLEFFLGLKKKMPEIKVKAVKGKRVSETVAIAQFSDVHAAEKVTLESTGGKNEFNLEICNDRIDLWCRKVLELINIKRTATNIETLIFAPQGDLCNGHLREEDLETNYLGPMDEGLFMFQQLKKCVDYYLKHGKFKKIIMPCNSGNHGRMTDKLRIHTEHENSLESFLYALLKDHYKDEPRVDIRNPRDTFTFVTVFDKFRLRFHHGTHIKGGGGIGGIFPSLFKYLFRQNATEKCFMDFMGHHHNHTTGKTFVINGCVVGYNAYARAKGFEAQPASQAITFIEKNLGLLGTEEIYLQKWDH